MGVGVGATLLGLSFLVLKHELPQLPLGKAALIPLWKRLLVCFIGDAALKHPCWRISSPMG